MPLLTELKRIRAINYKDVAPTALVKNELVGAAGGVTFPAAMKTLSAKAKISRLTLIGILTLATVTVAAPHTWVLKTGETVTGDYVSSGTTKIVAKTGGTNCFLNISDLSTNDLTYVAEMKIKQRQVRLDVEAKQMAQDGMVEFTTKLIENFPEKVRFKRGWMDVNFDDFLNTHVTFQELELGFAVRDKNGDWFAKCIVEKELQDSNYPSNLSDARPNPLVSLITSLKRGDKVRLIGECSPVDRSALNGDYRIIVEKIEMIESAVEKKAKEQPDAAAP